MAGELAVVPATEEHAGELAPRMRAADVEECAASSGLGPLPALLGSLKFSTYARTLLLDGAPIAMWGVGPSPTADTGILWLLGTDELGRHPRLFLTTLREEIAHGFTMFSSLTNCVASSNTKSVRWLRRLGFTFQPAIPFGAGGEPFHPFFMRREDFAHV